MRLASGGNRGKDSNRAWHFGQRQACIIPFAFAFVCVGVAFHLLVFAIRRPFRVGLNMISDPLSLQPCSNNAQRSARSP
jgi:hypothetical protein